MNRIIPSLADGSKSNLHLFAGESKSQAAISHATSATSCDNMDGRPGTHVGGTSTFVKEHRLATVTVVNLHVEAVITISVTNWQ
jgi:hypothetical protein